MFLKLFAKKLMKPRISCRFNFIKLSAFRNSFHSTKFTMSNQKNLLKPPAVVYGITKCDKEKFTKQIKVPYLLINNKKLSDILPIIRKYVLKLERFKAITNLGSNEIIYLNPEIVKDWSSISIEDQNLLETLSLNETHLAFNENFILHYDNYSVESIFRSVLPAEEEGFSSFTKVGHIVHVNLREHILPYKNLIGEVLYDKVPNCRTVVNKLDMIDNTFRYFKMEIIKGDDNMITQVKENKCTFEFDFSQVYWNSRLSTEHERIVNLLKADDVLFDVFAGVGPFSIPAAKKKCIVYANDLNPESYKWLNHNTLKNKIDSKYFVSFNKDGKDFILENIKEHLPKYLKSKHNVHIVMNLPASAVEFLKYFINLFNENDLEEFNNPPIVYVYCFAKGLDYMAITKNLIYENIGDISDKIIDIVRVRTVSSLKEMMRVSFKLERDILEGKKRKLDATDDDNKINKKCIAVIMGKNKKKNNVFKVAGAKSLKLKAKAKVVKGDLKQISIKNKMKVTQIDKELVHLEDQLRKPTSASKQEETNFKSKLPTNNNTEKLELLKKSDETAEILNSLNFN